MDVLLRLLERGRSFLHIQHPAQRAKWLAVATRRACLDLWRKRARETGFVPSEDLERLPAPPAPFEERSTLCALTDRLDADDRRICVLHHEEGCTKVEVHHRLGRSRPFIDQRLRKVKRQLERLTVD